MKNYMSRRFKSAVFAAIGTSLALVFAATVQADTDTNTPPPWVTSAAAGLTLTRGNSRTLLGTINIQTQKKTKIDEYLFGADATYGENDGTKNAETAHGFGQYNRLVTDRFYYGIRGDAMHDAIADVNYRLTLAPLVGYYFIKTTNNTLTGEVGPALVYQDSGGRSRGYATLRLGERYEHKFSPTAKLWQSFEILPQVDKFDNYYINAEIGVESALTKHMSLRTYLQDTYYNIPAPGRQKNDLKLVAAIAYKF